MQLSYRGAHYETHEPDVQPSGVEEIGRYRGAPCRRRRFIVPQHSHGRVQMTYRGVTYTQEV